MEVEAAVAEHDGHVVNSIRKCCALLDILGQAPDGMTLTQLTEALGIPYSTVHRLLRELGACAYVERDAESKRYFLGLHILELQANIAKRFHLLDFAIPHLSRLIQEMEVTSHLAVLQDANVVYLESRRSHGDPFYGMYTPPGRSVPAHCTALGKVLLAHLPPATLSQLLASKPLAAVTPHTIIDPAILQEQFATIRRRGYAVDQEEFALGVRCIAAPIRSRSGDVIAALSVSGRTDQVTPENIDELARRVVAECAQISRELGYVAG